MSRSLNRVMLIGNLGADPERRTTSSGTPVTTLSIATNRKRKDRNGNQQERTEWHRVICWDKLADVASEYLTKGDRVYIEGRIEYREYMKDDQKRYTTEIRARELIMLGDGGASTASGPSRTGDDLERFTADALAGNDDLPF